MEPISWVLLINWAIHKRKKTTKRDVRFSFHHRNNNSIQTTMSHSIQSFVQFRFVFKTFVSWRWEVIHNTRYVTVHRLNVKESIFIFIELTFCLIPMVRIWYIVYTCSWSNKEQTKTHKVGEQKWKEDKIS